MCYTDPVVWQPALRVRYLGTILAAGLLWAPDSTRAQDFVPNGDFETWVAGEPAAWSTSNYALPGSVTQSANAHTGSSALQGEPKELSPGHMAAPVIQSAAGGFPLSARWTRLNGFYQLASVGRDAVDITVLLFRNSQIVGTGYFADTVSRPGYTPLAVPLGYSVDSIPDTGFIFISMHSEAGFGDSLHVGSYFRLDDLAFTNDSGAVCPIELSGDVNASGDIKSSDVIYLVNYVLKAGADPLPCAASGDVNCDGEIKASDIIILVNYVFKAGASPCDVCAIIPAIWNCP
jgi:hypothetical protein